jgi:hypothetical protein
LNLLKRLTEIPRLGATKNFLLVSFRKRRRYGEHPVMMTAAGYRAMAEECIRWAREAHTEEVRASYLKLAQTWLDAASLIDGLPATPTQPSREDDQKLEN